MTQRKKTTKAEAKPAPQAKPAAELDEQELQKVSGGTGTLMEACATGKHIPEVKI